MRRLYSISGGFSKGMECVEVILAGTIKVKLK